MQKLGRNQSGAICLLTAKEFNGLTGKTINEAQDNEEFGLINLIKAQDLATSQKDELVAMKTAAEQLILKISALGV